MGFSGGDGYSLDIDECEIIPSLKFTPPRFNDTLDDPSRSLPGMRGRRSGFRVIISACFGKYLLLAIPGLYKRFRSRLIEWLTLLVEEVLSVAMKL
jgi:hypothetical protein